MFNLWFTFCCTKIRTVHWLLFYFSSSVMWRSVTQHTWHEDPKIHRENENFFYPTVLKKTRLRNKQTVIFVLYFATVGVLLYLLVCETNITNKRKKHTLYFWLQIHIIWFTPTASNHTKQWRPYICFKIAVAVQKNNGNEKIAYRVMEMQFNRGRHNCYQTRIVKYRTGDDVRCHLKIIVPGRKE